MHRFAQILAQSIAQFVNPSIAALAVLAIAAFASVASVASAATADLPPPPPIPVAAPVIDVYHGQALADPFRHLENTADPAVVEWMQAEGARSRTVLDSMPGRQKLIERMREIEAGAPARVFSVERLPGEKYRYLKRTPNDNGLRLYRRDGPRAKEQVVVDLATWLQDSNVGSMAFSFFSSSPSGRKVAYGLSESGGEATTMRVVDTATGAELIAPIDRTDLDSGESGDTGISWLMDDSGFFFNRLAPGGPERPAADRFKWSQAYLRRFGRPDDEARPLFGSEAKTGFPFEASDVPLMGTAPDDRYAIALVVRGTRREFSVYRTRTADAIAGRAKWIRWFDFDAKITGMAMTREHLYLLTYDGAPRYKLLRTRFLEPDIATATTLYAPERGVLVSIATASDALYMKVREGTALRLKRVVHGSNRIEDVPLPVAGSFEIVSPDSRVPGVLIRLEGWDRGYQFHRYDQRARRWINDGLQPAGRYDIPGNLDVVEAEAKSWDGTMVPLSIVHRKGIRLDGRNPTVLQGYGAYGSIDDASFEAPSLAWLERGGINATCHPRGGGVDGRAWYEAGRGPHKPNTWKDAIACAEWLIAHGYASRDTLAIWGGSAGGIFAGRAVIERPDLFVGVGITNGALDMVRSEINPVGSQNIEEFGSTKTAEGFASLLAMSTYRNVKDGVRYPAMLFIHGVNDARVEVWHSLKTVARMREAESTVRDSNPILLRLDFDGGHGAGSTRDQHFQELADLWSFLLWRTGDPEFQPSTNPARMQQVTTASPPATR